MGATRSVALLVFVTIVLMLGACSKRPQHTPEEELVAFARAHGSEWVSVISSLQGKNPRLAEQSVRLSMGARKMVRRFSISDSKLGKAPDLRHFPSLDHLQLAGDGMVDISQLAGLRVTYLALSSNEIADITAVASCPNIETLLLDHNPIADISVLNACAKLRLLHLVATQVRRLPDLSGLRSLEDFGIVSTPMESLDNLETIPSDFDLNIMFCENLRDITALRTARVKTLYIDKEETYERFRPWFEAHIDEIKAKRPEFNIQFEFIPGE